MTETEALVKANIESHEKFDDEIDDSELNEAQNNIEFVKQFKEELSKELYGQEQYC